MKNSTVLFFLPPNYAAWEPALLAAGLRWGFFLWESSHEVKTVGLTNEPIQSLGGFTTLPDYEIANAPDDFAALILVGGTEWRGEEVKRVLPLVRKAVEKQRVLGAICDASRFLAVHGFLNDVDHTSNELAAIQETPGSLYTGEAHYKNRQSVHAGNIITANGSAYVEFARDVLTALRVAPPEKIAEFYRMGKAGFCPV